MSTISQTFSPFAHGLRYDDVPAAVLRRAKLLVLDAVGVAFASSKFDFAEIALAAMRELGPGESVVIGRHDRLAMRDAAMMNATLVHGLDYDDTYLPGSVHPTATIVPCALAVSVRSHASGRDFIVACAAGLEAAARIGLASKARLSKAGFQPTSICGAMASALVAGKLLDLDEAGLTRAQGIVLGMASGSMQAAQDGTWAKRIQPGWAVAGAITAAVSLAPWLHRARRGVRGKVRVCTGYSSERSRPRPSRHWRCGSSETAGNSSARRSSNTRHAIKATRS